MEMIQGKFRAWFELRSERVQRIFPSSTDKQLNGAQQHQQQQMVPPPMFMTMQKSKSMINANHSMILSNHRSLDRHQILARTQNMHHPAATLGYASTNPFAITPTPSLAATAGATSSPSSRYLANSSGKYLNSLNNDYHGGGHISNTQQPESLYATVTKNRPRKPPPYKEAIAKSHLVNMIQQNGGGGGSDACSSDVSGCSSTVLPAMATTANNSPNHPYALHHHHQTSQNGYHQTGKQQNMNAKTTTTSLSSFHQGTMSLIELQQKTMKDQENVSWRWFRCLETWN